MNIKLILAKCLIILFCENKINNLTYSNKDFVLESVGKLNIPSDGVSITFEHTKWKRLRELAMELVRCPDKFIEEQKMADLKIICDDDNALYQSIYDSVSMIEGDEDLNRNIISLKKDIIDAFKLEEVKEIIAKASSQIRFRTHEIKDYHSYLGELISDLTTYYEDLGENEKHDPAITSEIDFSTGEGLREVLESIKDEASGDTIIKTPWQAFNRMTRGGLRRGQTTLVSALQHHAKSAICLSLCLGACLYNKAQETLTDKTKKATILYISLENSPELTIANTLYFLKGNLEGVAFGDQDLASLKIEESSMGYLQQQTEVNGYHFKTLRVIPHEWSYIDLFNKIQKLEDTGHEIHLCCVDYLNMMPKTGCAGGNEADKIQDLFNKVRNFMAKKRIAFLTPHQLSSEANELHRQGRKELATIVSGGNYYAGSKGIGREVDLEIFLYKVEHNGNTYLCIARGKHRVSGVTPDKDLNFILPFKPEGGLRWDYDKADTSIRKLGQTRNEDGSLEDPFWGERHDMTPF